MEKRLVAAENNSDHANTSIENEQAAPRHYVRSRYQKANVTDRVRCSVIAFLY